MIMNSIIFYNYYTKRYKEVTGLVVMGGDSWLSSNEFESRRLIQSPT